MSEHTPGPWVAGSHGYAYPTTPKTGGRESSQKFRRVLGGGREVARVWVGDVDAEPDAAPSNFRLIAAAPELLSCLHTLRIVFANLEGWRDMDATLVDQFIASDGLHRVDTAIAKAEGRGE